MKYQILNDFDQCLIRIEDLLGEKVTTNTQLLKLGKMLFGYRFKDVYCSDSHIKLSNNECCIVNTDSSKQAGTHWVGLFKYRDHYYVFDSFGRDIKTLSKFFKFKNWTNVEHTRRESFKGSNCGQLSMIFCLTFDRYKCKCIGVL